MLATRRLLSVQTANAVSHVGGRTGTYFILNGPEYVVFTRILQTDTETDGMGIYYLDFYFYVEVPRQLGWSPSGTLRLSRGMS